MKKNRSISKGVIEAKDKTDVKSQQFSPTMAKRTVGINLNTFINSKPQTKNEEDEMRSSTNNMSFQPNQSTSTNMNNSNVNSTMGQGGTTFQKYSKNPISQPKTLLSNTQFSQVSNSTVNNSTFVTPFPQKNMKLESIKNINTVIKKLKSNNISSGKIKEKQIPKKIPLIPASFNQTQNICLLQKSIQMPTLTIKNNNLNSQQYFPPNQSEMSPSTSMTNINSNDMLYKTNQNIFQHNSGQKIKIFEDKFDKIVETKNEKKVSLQETKDNSSNNSTIKNFKHSNSNSINCSQTNYQVNIENPEDLHFFYVKMLQQNKEFANKFEKDEV